MAWPLVALAIAQELQGQAAKNDAEIAAHDASRGNLGEGSDWLASLPRYASGTRGPVRRGHYAMVGEDDDELAYLAPGSRVFGNPGYGRAFDPVSPRYMPDLYDEGDEFREDPQPRYPEYPEGADDNAPHGFWEKAHEYLGDNPIQGQLPYAVDESPLGYLLRAGMVVGNVMANRAGQQHERRMAANKQMVEDYRTKVKQTEANTEAWRIRTAGLRRARAADSRRRREFEGQHVQDPRTGKWYPAQSEAGLRTSNPRLADQVYASAASKGPAPSNAAYKDDEAMAEREYRETVSNFTREKGWEAAGGDRQNYSLFPPSTLPKSVADPDTNATVAAARSKWHAAQVVSALYEAKTEGDLDAAVSRAQQLGVFDDPKIKAAIEAVARKHGW